MAKTCIVITQMLVLSKGAPKLSHIFYDALSGSSYTNEKFYPNNQRVKEYYLNPPIIKRRDANIEEENTKAPKLGAISSDPSSKSSYTNEKYYRNNQQIKEYPSPPITKRRDANIEKDNTKAPNLGESFGDLSSESSYTNGKYYPNIRRVKEYYTNPLIIKRRDANIEEENTKSLKLGEIFGDLSSESSYTNGKYYPYIRRVKDYYPNPPIIKRRDANIKDKNTKAPKFGESFVDPSSESSFSEDIYNPNNRRVKEYYPNPLIIKRRDTNVEDENTESPCDNRYEYDEMKCTIINNRILCGYNKNNGKVKNSAEVVNMGNGCRMRNNRIECGYFEGPFDGSIRPRSKQKLTLIKPTRTLSREKIIQKLRSSLRETKTKHTPQTSITINTVTADDESKLTLTTATIDVSKQSNSAAFDNRTAENVTNEGVTKNEIKPNVTPKKVNNNIKLNLRTLIVLMASTTLKSTTITPTTSLKTVAKVADTTVVQNKTISDVKSNRNSILVEMTTITANSTKINVTEDKTNDDPPPLCIDKEDRIVCYDTAKFILFKKPTKT